MEKYLSANSHVKLPCIIDRSNPADLYFLAIDGQPRRGRHAPGSPLSALRQSCVVHGLPYAFAESAGVDRPHLWAVPV